MTKCDYCGHEWQYQGRAMLTECPFCGNETTISQFQENDPEQTP